MRWLGFYLLTLTLFLAIPLRAEQPTHWAYKPPRQPPLPVVQNHSWPRNPIDYFVLKQLEAKSMSPSIEADRASLLRRATFALTGLPPTLDELDVFLADTAPNAYEKVLDRLLASPRYAERMAQHWLDLARYADTHGYHADAHRDMWRWRDWVIDAFNRDLPFDQFTVEQLAGDLLPNATIEQKIATGFNRNHIINFENGAIAEEYRTEYVADRTITSATVWLGQTLQCARCHDHKHDPFTQRDFYQFFAFFNNVPENGLDGQKGNAAPFIVAPGREQQRELDRFALDLDHIQQQMNGMLAALPEDNAAWEKTLSVGAKTQPIPASDMVLHVPFDETEGTQVRNLSNEKNPGKMRGDGIWMKGTLAGALLFNGETSVEFPPLHDLREDKPFAMTAWIFPTTDDEMSIVAGAEENSPYRGIEWYLDHQNIFLAIRQGSEGNLIVASVEKVALRKWQHITVAYDGLGKGSGVRFFLDGNPLKTNTVQGPLMGVPPVAKTLRIGHRIDSTGFRGMLDELRIFRRNLTHDEIAMLAGQNPVSGLLTIPSSRRTAEQKLELRRYYLESSNRDYQQLKQQATILQRKLDDLKNRLPTTMVMQELPEPRETFVLQRGKFDQRGEKVAANTPAVLFPLKTKGQFNRLALAEWIVDRDNPLTSRVAVNRFWQMHFGMGLVRTAEDFGTKGELPTHPELLDWLATDFAGAKAATVSAWSMKRLHRSLLTSATFRQTSRLTPELTHADPTNRWLARGPRQRLPAESIRDLALSASGLLNRKVGGPSIYPYQPAGLWEEVAYDTGLYSAQNYLQSHGEDLYRRGVYVFWKRAVPSPMLATFDASDREVCTVVRPSSNTPLQALVLMNETTIVEGSRKFAERAMLEGGDSPAQRATFLFRWGTSREPTAIELQTLLRSFEFSFADYKRDPISATKLLKVGESPIAKNLDPQELAAWTTVANIVFSLDETITNR